MASQENPTEVKEFIQKVEITPTKDTELIDEEIETQEDSSTQETTPETEVTEVEPEKEETEETTAPEAVEPTIIEPKPVESETPRERALRLETTRLRGLLRKERTDELFPTKKVDSVTPVDEELSKYDPEELKNFEILATKMGFAKKDDILNQNSQERMDAEFEGFLETHPEYSPENDKDGLMWGQFKSEFGLYNPPKDPKTLKKVLNKVHNEIVGFQPTANLTKINASLEKIKVASHTGASTGKANKSSSVQSTPNLRKDMMKGFSDDELSDLLG